MKSKTPLAASVALFVAAAALGCGVPQPFTRAARAYATASRESIDAISTAPVTAYDICYESAMFSYLQANLGIAEGDEVAWTKWYSTVQATDKLSWQDYCNEIKGTGRVFTLTITVLVEYGAALKTLAEGADYGGSDVTKAAESAGSMTGALGHTMVGDAMKQLGAPLASLAGFLVQEYTEGRIKEYVVAADPVVQPILQGLTAYVDALESELTRVERKKRQAIDKIEAGSGLLAGAPADPMKVAHFHQMALAIEKDIRTARAVLEGYRAVLQGLKTAHAELMKAGKVEGDASVKTVLGSVAELLTNVAALRMALQEKE